MTEPIVQRGDHQYEIRVGEDAVGLAQYIDRGNQRVFYHTEIDPAFQGRGLSSTLIHHALDDTRDAGLRIVPVCPTVNSYLKKHSSFDGITDSVNPEVLSWLKAALARDPDEGSAAG